MRAISLILIFAAAVLAALPTAASEPGQPLDCSDWVFVEAGYFCRPYEAETSPWTVFPGEFQRAFDNAGRLLRVTRVLTTYPPTLCGGYPMTRTEIQSYDGKSERLIAFVEDRCAGITLDQIQPVAGSPGVGPREVVKFDPVNGRLLVPLFSSAPGGPWTAAIEGFTTSFEILQSYEPATNAWGFRVPYMPEGLPAADHFDIYYGDLATVGDWSQAQPLQCGFPSTPPNLGDYLAVTDSFPTPVPNAGRYYVTAVNHQGQRRYGRQRINGVLSGRDPSVLPVCGE